MANFDEAYGITSVNEGGIANNKNDRGGLTYAGISEKYWPAWKGWPFVKAALALVRHPGDFKTANAHLAVHPEVKLLVHDFYKANFWDTLNLNRIDDQQLANAIYDFGVNAGISTSGKKLQSAINSLGGSLSIDGAIGSQTIDQANKLSTAALYASFNIQRRNYYNAIVQNDPSQKQFLAGWLKRIKPYQT